MTVKIEVGGIHASSAIKKYRRWIEITDSDYPNEPIVSRAIYADTIEELEIIDHENFMKE